MGEFSLITEYIMGFVMLIALDPWPTLSSDCLHLAGHLSFNMAVLDQELVQAPQRQKPWPK